MESPVTERYRHGFPRLLVFAIFMVLPLAVCADIPVLEIEIRGHLFYPSELTLPANTKVKLIVYNRDPTPEEFESYELNREKVIMGGQKAIIFIGPLTAGVYPFFGEFNPKTAQGKIIAQ
jgi:hypothetical protein